MASSLITSSSWAFMPLFLLSLACVLPTSTNAATMWLLGANSSVEFRYVKDDATTYSTITAISSNTLQLSDNLRVNGNLIVGGYLSYSSSSNLLVSSSSCTSTCTNLDIYNLDFYSHTSQYKVVIKLYNPLSTSTTYRLYLGVGNTLDTTDTNYYSTSMYTSSATTTPTNYANPTIMTAAALSYHTMSLYIFTDTNGKRVITGQGGIQSSTKSSSSIQYHSSWIYHDVAANINTLRVTAAAASAIGTSSTVQVYKL